VPDLAALSNLVLLGGGFAFAAGALLLIVKALFDAWRKGELVSRSVHDAAIDRLVAENTALRTDYRDAIRELGRLSDTVDDLGRRVERR
jgi:hypothetical protein